MRAGNVEDSCSPCASDRLAQRSGNRTSRLSGSQCNRNHSGTNLRPQTFQRDRIMDELPCGPEDSSVAAKRRVAMKFGLRCFTCGKGFDPTDTHAEIWCDGENVVTPCPSCTVASDL